MGWNQSPYYFVTWLSQLILYLKKPVVLAPNAQYTAVLQWFDYSIVAYMHDLLFVSHMSPQWTWQLIMLLHSIFSAFGIAVSAAKNVLEPV